MGPCQALNEVVRGPRAGELHLAFLECFAGADELVHVALDALGLDEVGDIEQHLAVVHGATGDLFILGREEALHLDRDGTTFGLALALPGSSFPQVGEIFLANIVFRGDGTKRLLDTAVPEVERILIRVALRKSEGLKQDAAKLLGWGRNTLTRKMKELGMEDVG